jgi:hypothetical protein
MVYREKLYARVYYASGSVGVELGRCFVFLTRFGCDFRIAEAT